MGRMLDALKRTSTNPAPVPVSEPPVVEAMPVVEAVECPDEPDVPFIEVGGPRSTLEASPEVLAVPMPQSVRQEPKPPPEDECVPTGMVSIWCSCTLRPGVKVIG
jgi:hypothetical protein